MDKLEKALEKARQLRQGAEGAAPTAAETATAEMLPQMPVQADASNIFSLSNKLDEQRIIALHTRNPQADMYRMLRTKVLQIMKQNNFRTLAITSPNYGDGKTTTSINLALSLALDVKQTVLLVDLDLRKPNLHAFLSGNSDVGLSNYLVHNTPLQDCMVRPAVERLNTLPAGPAMEHSSEILGSPKMAGLARELRTRYPDRIVIYDMPPVLAQDDSIAFTPHVDAVLVVINNGVTKTDEVKQCLDSLAKANVIGTVLNNTRWL
jgi:capsular exopolysaccharide synthesis family protein